MGERDLLARAGNDEFVLLREIRPGEDDPAALAHALIVSLYDPCLTQQNQRRLQLESAPQHTIDRGQLRLVYQPQTDGEGRLMGRNVCCAGPAPTWGRCRRA